MVEPSGHCPHLGLKQNRAIRFASPTPEHRCFVSGEAQEIPVDQATFCLSQGHTRCPLYMGLPLPSTPLIAEVPPTIPKRGFRAWLAGLSPFNRAIYIVLLVMLALIIGTYGFIGIQVIISNLPTQPTTVLVITATSGPTNVPSPSPSPEPTLSPTLTPTLPIPTATVDVPVPPTPDIPSPVSLPTDQQPTPTLPTPIPPFASPTVTPSEAPSETPEPPSETPEAPSATLEVPSATPEPPSATPEPPIETPTEAPSATPEVPTVEPTRPIPTVEITPPPTEVRPTPAVTSTVTFRVDGM